MKTKVLTYLTGVCFLVMWSTINVEAQDVCQDYHDKYRVCVEGADLGHNPNPDACLLLTDELSCASAGCLWRADKNICITDMCVTDVNFDGRVATFDYAALKREFGRFGCKTKPLVSAPAPVPKTGQTEKYADYDDGDLEKGVAWPNPRFTDNGNGTVTDNLTGLIWLRDANCFGQRTWDQALSDCHNLQTAYCGLTDGSNIGDWRLPNQGELQSLMHFGFYNPAVPNTAGTGKWSEGDPFINVQYGFTDSYWSSTTTAWEYISACI